MEEDGFKFSESFQNGLNTMFDYLPQVFGAIILLLVGYIVAKVLQGVVRKLLTSLRFDRALHVSPAGTYISRVVESPTRLVARIAYWIVFLLFVSLAVTALNIPALNELVVGVYSYIPKIIAAILIFLVASAIVGGGEKFIRRVLGTGPLAKVIGAILPAVVMSIAIFMILSELQIAENIINITYTAIMGSIGLGLALAFGLGGRDVAARILEQAYSTTQANKGNIKSAARTAKSNTQDMAS